jgi:hypothetical protein
MKKMIVGGLAAAAAAIGVAVAAPANAYYDAFVMCPDGHEGVVGEHTSCGFAQNVRNGYYALGRHFDAYSPATDEWYEVKCTGYSIPAHFVDGAVVSAVQCFASSNAEVVVW